MYRFASHSTKRPEAVYRGFLHQQLVGNLPAIPYNEVALVSLHQASDSLSARIST